MRKIIFLLFFIISFIRADIYLNGYIHVGDNDDFAGYIPMEPITYDGEHTYKYYLDYPTDFYLSKQVTLSGVELVDAKGIASDDRIKVFIDGKKVGRGSKGSNIIYFSLTLSAGFHTIALKGSCYSNGKRVSCNSSDVDDIDDFYFKGYKLLTNDTDNNVKNFIQRHHIGDDTDTNDWYDDLSDDYNKPFWYPDDNEGTEISYDFNITCNVSSVDFYLYRVRDVDYTDTNTFQFYINDKYAGYAYINTNDDGVYNLHFVYQNSIKGPFKGTVKVVSGADFWGDYDDFSWDELMVVPHCETNTQETNSTFNAVDYISDITQCNAVNDWDDNITTKLVNKEFNLSILAKNPNTDTPLEANITKVTLYYYNSSSNGKCSGSIVGSKVICQNCGSTGSNGCLNLDNSNLDVNRAVKCIEVNIEGKALSNTSTDVNESNSTDNFAVRPYKFIITNIPNAVKAGNDFNITIKAVDENGNPVKDYNETVYIRGSSADLEYNETKAGCETGKLLKVSGGEFKNGEANVTLKYSEVGDVNFTVQEVNGSEFAITDSDDTNDTLRFIKPASRDINIGVDHFDINGSFYNYDRENNFTYYDDGLNIAAELDLNISAVSKGGKALKNYNDKCYAENIDINISHNDADVNVSKILYKYIDMNNSEYEGNVSVNDSIDILYSKNNFISENNGSAEIKIFLNFNRDFSSPVDPFEFNITKIDVNDTDANGTNELNETARYYYGNLLLSDIIAKSDDFNKSYDFVMYDENGNDTLKPDSKQEVINWYHNVYHQIKDGNVSDSGIIVSKDYNSSDTISGISVNAVYIKNGVIDFEIKRSSDNITFAVIHLMSPYLKWLWYSKFKQPYNISKGSTCLNHFCFTVTWPNNNQGEIGSGDFTGTEANITDTNSTKRGVKIFR